MTQSQGRILFNIVNKKKNHVHFIFMLKIITYIQKNLQIFNLILELKTLKMTNKTMVFVSPRI